LNLPPFLEMFEIATADEQQETVVASVTEKLI
jgi:hypothetical protein